MQNNQRIGLVTSVFYVGSVAWLGKLLVEPTHRFDWPENALLEHILRWHESLGARCVETHIQEDRLSLYQQHGFVSVSKINRWQIRRSAAAVTPRPNRIRNGLPSDRRKVIAIDQEANGMLRGRVLYRLPGSIDELPLVRDCKNAGRPAFGFARPGDIASWIGPLIAPDRFAAKEILKQLLTRLHNRPVWMDIPEENNDANDLAKECGFYLNEKLIEVRRGPRKHPKNPALVYATGGPIIG